MIYGAKTRRRLLGSHDIVPLASHQNETVSTINIIKSYGIFNYENCDRLSKPNDCALFDFHNCDTVPLYFANIKWFSSGRIVLTIWYVMFRFVVSTLALATMLSTAAHSGEAVSEERFDVSIRDQNVRDVFKEISVAIGVPILLSEAVDGRVSASFDQATADELLDGIAKFRALDWRFDGGRIRVTSQSEQITRIIDLNGITLDKLTGALESLDVYNDRFQMTAVDGEFGMVVGPPDYIAVVEVVLGALIQRQADTKVEEERIRRENLELKRLAFEQKLELDRLERQAELERLKLEQDQLRAWQREQLLKRQRRPSLVRNGVWGG